MDYYLENPERLEGQPKRTIADYVESKGILVPRRFDTLAEARRSHKGIFLRSEHPQEYAGVSGLLQSFNLGKRHFGSRGAQTLEEVKEQYLTKGVLVRAEVFCETSGIDYEDFKEEVSFSLWEKLSGYFRTVCADSAIPERYHVMTYLYTKKSYDDKNGTYLYNYSIVDNGLLVRDNVVSLPQELKDNMPSLIEQYEVVRQLDHFDPQHCPIMEFQTVGDKHYFLQYHRGGDASPSTFELDREPSPNEVEVPFVRGATTLGGDTFKITVHYHTTLRNEWGFQPEDEDGSYDFHENFIFSEIQSRKRAVMMNHAKNEEDFLMKTIVDHKPRSLLFKPKISIIHNINNIMRVRESTKDFLKQTENGHNSFVNLHITSDGRRAFIERID